MESQSELGLKKKGKQEYTHTFSAVSNGPEDCRPVTVHSSALKATRSSAALVSSSPPALPVPFLTLLAQAAM